MKKLFSFITIFRYLLFNHRIKLSDRILFCITYSSSLLKTFIIRPKIKTANFLTGKKFFYSGNHINLLLDHLYIDLNYYYPFLEKACIIFDVGASFGTFSLMANYFNPEAKIYAFEPAKESFLLLKKNCQEINSIKINNIAIGESPGIANFKFDKNYPEGSKIINEKIKGYYVQKETLDSFANNNKIKEISLLKIDVEGYELKVLLGAVKIIKNTKYIIIETDVSDINNLVKVFNYMKNYNFSLVNFGSFNFDQNKEFIASVDFIFKKNE